MKTVKGYLVDVFKDSVTFVEVKDDLEEFYSLLNCNCIDVVTRIIGNHTVSIVCDDEALLKDDPIASACDIEGTPMLFGSLLICGTGVEDDSASLENLSYEERYEILSHTGTYVDNKRKVHPIVILKNEF